MFTVTDTVANTTGAAVDLTPYGRVTRLGEPTTAGYYILHEGLIGVLGDEGLQEVDYSDLDDEAPVKPWSRSTRGWLGITDKYWAAALVPPREAAVHRPRSSAPTDPRLRYQADFRRHRADRGRRAAAVESTNHLFAGAKQVSAVGRRLRQRGLRSASTSKASTC